MIPTSTILFLDMYRQTSSDMTIKVVEFFDDNRYVAIAEYRKLILSLKDSPVVQRPHKISWKSVDIL
jgi:hypothetical protein